MTKRIIHLAMSTSARIAAFGAINLLEGKKDLNEVRGDYPTWCEIEEE